MSHRQSHQRYDILLCPPRHSRDTISSLSPSSDRPLNTAQFKQRRHTEALTLRTVHTTHGLVATINSAGTMSSVSSASASVHSGVGGASKISTSLALKCLWICALSFQYGYNISALNGLHDVMQCAGDGQNNKDGHALIPPCYDMTVRPLQLPASSTVSALCEATGTDQARLHPVPLICTYRLPTGCSSHIAHPDPSIRTPQLDLHRGRLPWELVSRLNSR